MSPVFKLKVLDTMSLLGLKREIHLRSQSNCDLRVNDVLLKDEQNCMILRDLLKHKDKIVLERKQDPEVRQAQFFENGQMNQKLKRIF